MAQYDGEIVLNTKINSEGFKAGSKELEAAVRAVANSVDGLGEKTRNSINKSVTAFAKQNNAYAEQKRKVDELKAKIAELSNQKVATSEWKEIQAQIDSAKSRINTLIDQQDRFLTGGGSTSARVFQSRQSEIEQLKETIAEAEKEQNQLLSEGKAYKPVDTSQLQQELSAAESKLRLSGESIQNSVSGITARISSAGKTAAVNSSKMGMFGNAVRTLGAKSAQIAKTGLSTLGSGLKSVAGKALQGAKSLLSFGRSGGSAGGRLKTGLTTILKYAFGIRSLFRLVNRIRGAITEGVKAFASADAETQNSINNLKVSLNNLKLSFASAFAPIINTIVPYLQILIGWLTTAINTVGKFFAALTGKSTYKQATTNSTSLTASTSKNTSATNKNTAATKKATKATKDKAKATKKAKKENDKYLSGLDEMAIWEDKVKEAQKPDTKTKTPSTSTPKTGGVGGAGGAGGPKIKMAEVEIPKSIKNFADTIKKLIAKGDWKGVGSLIADKLDNALRSIPWGKIKAGALKIGTNLADFFKGVFANLSLAESIGNTIAQAFNTALNFVYGFLSTFDFKKFGTFLGTSFTSIVKNIEWGKIGTSIALGLNGIKNTIDGFWDGYEVGSTAKGLSSAINNFISKTDWKGIAITLGNSIMNICDEAIAFLQEVDWAQIGQAIVDFVTSIDYFGIAKKVVSLLGNALGSAVRLIFGILKGLWDKLVEYFKSLWKSGGGNIFGFIWGLIKGIFGKIFGMLGSLVGGIVDGIFGKGTWDKVVNFFSGIWNAIKTVLDPVISFFKTVFGAVWSVLKAIFTPVIGFFKMVFGTAWKIIKAIWGAVKPWFMAIWNGIKAVFGPVVAFFKKAFGDAVARIKAVFSVLKAFFTIIWGAIKKVFGPVVSWFKEKFGQAFARIKAAFAGAKKVFTAVWEGIKGVFSNVAGFFKNTFGKAWEAVKGVFSKGGKIFDGIKEGIANTFGNIAGKIIGGINKVIKVPFQALRNALNKIRNIKIIKWHPFKWIKKDLVPVPQIPTKWLPGHAKGAVIPPRSEYLARLGDQKVGTNIETPERLMRQVFADELKHQLENTGNGEQNIYEFVAQINRKNLFDEVIKEGKMRKRATGKNAFAL